MTSVEERLNHLLIEELSLDKFLLVFDMHRRAQEIWYEGAKPPANLSYEEDVNWSAEECCYDEREEELKPDQRWIIWQNNEAHDFKKFSDRLREKGYSEEQLRAQKMEFDYNADRELMEKLLADADLGYFYRNYQVDFAHVVFNMEKTMLTRVRHKEEMERREQLRLQEQGKKTAALFNLVERAGR